MKNKCNIVISDKLKKMKKGSRSGFGVWTRFCPRCKRYFKATCKQPVCCPECYLPTYTKKKGVKNG